jgi:hypothetical protein
VNSITVSDQGEPHTQEHLLLHKGTRGRAYSNQLTMSLAGMSAFTQQWRTAYHFNTTAGADTIRSGRMLSAVLASASLSSRAQCPWTLRNSMAAGGQWRSADGDGRAQVIRRPVSPYTIAEPPPGATAR